MARFITFGSSNTYGQYLQDRQKEVYGAITSNLLGREFVNKGELGASNKFICHEVLNFNYQKDDLVYILWTFNDRYCVFNTASSYDNIVPESTDELGLNFYRYFHTPYDVEFMNKVFINRAVDFLNKNNIEVYVGFNNINYSNFLEQSSNIVNLLYSDYYYKYPRASDNLHMGKEGNLVYGTHLAKAIALKSII